ncbi:hypothetical protein KJ988_05330, partial [bacterium]|nr:hypothetical protein [bacterium]
MQRVLRFLLIALFFNTLLLAKSSESCYSVQLKSFVIKDSSNYDFESHGYPESCKLISFTNINAVRCGCFEKYYEAKQESQKFLGSYPEAKIVSTYKYRFAKNKSLPKIEEFVKLSKESVVEVREEKSPITEVKEQQDPQQITQASEEVPQKSEAENIFNQINIRGSFALAAQAYLIAPTDKHAQNFTASAELESVYNQDDFQAVAKLTAQQDYYDFQKSPDTNERSFIRLDELYGKYNFDDEQIMFGKNIRFWGALEARNITDTFNSDDLRADPFYKDKLGSWNAAFTHYTQAGEFSAIIKLYEQEREIAAFAYVYYYFPATVSVPALNAALPLKYVNTLDTEESSTRPSIYLKYAATADSEYALDYAVIFENGYDSQRYYTQTLSPDASYLMTNENAYLVNKLTTFNTLVLGATLYKLEAVYTDVLDDKVISDYFHLGLGLEHTVGEFYEGADLGLIAEYYSYSVLENNKRNDLELFEV